MAAQIVQQTIVSGAQTISGPTTTFTATAASIGQNQGSHNQGSGCIAVGGTPHSGQAVYINAPALDLQDASGEYIALGAICNVTPTAPAGAAAASFGCVINSTWGGSADSGATGLNYGGQFISYTSGSANILKSMAIDCEVVALGTGTITYAYAAWLHIGTTGAGTLTNAACVRVDASNGGGATFGTLMGIDIPALNLAAAGSNIGINIANQADADYAVKAGTGRAKFGGAVETYTGPVSGLPTGHSGARAFVTDATSATFGAAVTGSGSNKVPVYHDGTSWLVG